MENSLNKRGLQKGSHSPRTPEIRWGRDRTRHLAVLFRTIAASSPQTCRYSQMVRATMGISFIARTIELFSYRPRQQGQVESLYLSDS